MKTLFLLLTGCLLSAAALAETAEESVKRLEGIWVAASESGSPLDAFLQASKEVADQHGIAVIAPIMERVVSEGEGAIFYALVIVFLPHAQVERELKKHQEKEGSPEAFWAGELLREFKEPDSRFFIKKRR